MDQLDFLLDCKEKLNPPRSAELTEAEKRQVKDEMLQSYQAQAAKLGMPSPGGN
ncbi:MAG: hypothetical protein ACRDMV_10880 [Streptosporangiales bacterium]